MIIVPCKIFFTDQKIVVFVELPELTVNDVKMFIWEVVCNLVDIIFFLQPTNSLEKTKSVMGWPPVAFLPEYFWVIYMYISGACDYILHHSAVKKLTREL